MSNARENRIKQLEEQLEKARAQNTELHRICQRQRDSLAAQQETIVQLNISLDKILVCIAEKYGVPVELDGEVVRQLSFPLNAFPGALDRCQPSAIKNDADYVITVAKRPQEGEELHEVGKWLLRKLQHKDHQEGEYEAAAKTERLAD